MNPKMVTKKDLPTLLEHTNELLYCPICDSRYSAIRGDYCFLSDNEILKCCGESMILTKEICIIEAEE